MTFTVRRCLSYNCDLKLIINYKYAKMAPKPKENKETTKTGNKKKEKVIDDLTFGLKNKNKSKVV